MLAWNNERMRRYRCRVGVAYSELPSLVEAFLAPRISLQILETYLVLNRHTIKEEDFLVLHNSLTRLGSVSEHSNQRYMAACLVLLNSLQTTEDFSVPCCKALNSSQTHPKTYLAHMKATMKLKCLLNQNPKMKKRAKKRCESLKNQRALIYS